jgi:hypothetical protein
MASASFLRGKRCSGKPRDRRLIVSRGRFDGNDKDAPRYFSLFLQNQVEILRDLDKLDPAPFYEGPPNIPPGPGPGGGYSPHPRKQGAKHGKLSRSDRDAVHAGFHGPDDRKRVEGLHQGGTARVGRHHSFLQSLHHGQDRWKAGLVDAFDYFPAADTDLGAIASIVLSVMVMIELAKAFGKGTGFALGLVFLGFIFFPILGFGDAQYAGTAVAEGVSESAPDA